MIDRVSIEYPVPLLGPVGVEIRSGRELQRARIRIIHPSALNPDTL